MTQLFLENAALWAMVSAGMACLAIWIGISMEAAWPATANAALACMLLWPAFTVLLVFMLLLGCATLVVVALSLMPTNFVLALRGLEPIKPYPPSDKQASKGAA